MNRLKIAGVRGIAHGLLFVLAVGCAVVTTGPGNATAAKKPADDLLKQSHVYLLRGDDKFGNFAPDYSHTIPTLDSTIQVEIRSFKPKEPEAGDSAQYLTLQLQRPMALRVVVADSTERGLVAYEFEQMPAGEYSLGFNPWPKHLSEKLSDQSTIIVYVVSDKRLQRRYKFAVDTQHRLVRGTDATPSGK
jgi:hypothetical protein